VHRRLRRGARAVHGGALLSGAQVELLRLVQARPGIGVGEAAGALHLAPNTVSTLVRSLCDEGLLRRRADARDGRAARLELTEAAHERIRRRQDERARLLALALDDLDADERAALDRALPALRHALAELEELT
jgi:DNA-binding MarR family transcriptional regulator